MTLALQLTRALARPLDPAVALLAGDDHYLTTQDSNTLLAAAVLIPVTDRPAPGVILTQRHERLRRHPGQVAFPGGRIDPEDTGPVAAALREAEEEIALPSHLVTIIGPIDRYRTITGFEVTPVIGVIPPDLLLIPNEDEVAAVFEVPLAFLLDTANHQPASREWQGKQRRYTEIMWEDRQIWGATAAMIVNLARRLRWTE